MEICVEWKESNEQKREEHIGIEKGATHIGWYRLIENMYKASGERNKGQINDQ